MRGGLEVVLKNKKGTKIVIKIKNRLQECKLVTKSVMSSTSSTVSVRELNPRPFGRLADSLPLDQQVLTSVGYTI